MAITKSGLIGHGCSSAIGALAIGTPCLEDAVVITATATINGIGSVSADAAVTRTATATINGIGSVSADAAVTRTATATINGIGSVSADAAVIPTIPPATATINGIGSISASASVTTKIKRPSDGFPNDFHKTLGAGPGVPLGVVSGNFRHRRRKPAEYITIKFKYQEHKYLQIRIRDERLYIKAEDIDISHNKDSDLEVRMGELVKV